MDENGATRSEPLRVNNHLLSKGGNQMWYFWDAPRTLGISHNGTPSAEGDSSSVTHPQPWNLCVANKKSHINAGLFKLYGDKCTNVPQLLTETHFWVSPTREQCPCMCVSVCVTWSAAIHAKFLACCGEKQFSVIITSPDTQHVWAHVPHTDNTSFCTR